MADPISVLSVLAGAISFIDSAQQVLNQARQIYLEGTGTSWLAASDDIQVAIDSLRATADALAVPDDTGPSPSGIQTVGSQIVAYIHELERMLPEQDRSRLMMAARISPILFPGLKKTLVSRQAKLLDLQKRLLTTM